MKRAACFLSVVSSLVLYVSPLPALAQTVKPAQVVTIDVKAPPHPFPHFWEQMFGSGRATLSLRESYREDLRAVKGITGFHYIRFHDILDDSTGLYSEDKSGNPVYNFSYVDQIYDGLLANGIRPYVELSFMPSQLAAAPIVRQAFWYHPIVSPPKSWSRWDDLIQHFARHLVNRYGIGEVSKWYFEVWNEPNIDFWAGNPKQATYFQLYDHTARDIKRVSPRLRVGGPSTAQAAWVASFIRHDVQYNVPVDFISTHVYGNDTAANVFGTAENIPRNRMVCRAAKKVRDEVLASARPQLPVIFSEYNASYMNEPDVTDTIFMGPWLADTVRQCDGLVNMLSYWTFSDVFDEQGVIKKPFYGGFGLVAEGGVPKPSFNAFRLLHMLGTERIPVASDSVLATRHKDGSLAIAVWNYSPARSAGAPKQITLQFSGLKGKRHVTIYRLDADHGNALPAYAGMGSPASPTQQQYQTLKAAARLSAPETRKLKKGRITLTLPAKALDLVEIR
ncbi:MAG: GH39 family glycosyl hydrolase [Candidatus Acidiferrales bacterium]